MESLRHQARHCSLHWDIQCSHSVTVDNEGNTSLLLQKKSLLETSLLKQPLVDRAETYKTATQKRQRRVEKSHLTSEALNLAAHH